MMARTRKRRRTDQGFTLVEVLIALLIAMIGLMGTVAIQQTVLTSTKNANDAQIAMRLASQTAEELQARVTIPAPGGLPPIDLLQPMLAMGAVGNPDGTGGTSVFLDELGNTNATATPQFRWQRSILVTDPAGPGFPYQIRITIDYALQSGQPKQMRLDLERRKNW